jgi:hypothetical protein
VMGGNHTVQLVNRNVSIGVVVDIRLYSQDHLICIAEDLKCKKVQSLGLKPERRRLGRLYDNLVEGVSGQGHVLIEATGANYCNVLHRVGWLCRRIVQDWLGKSTIMCPCNHQQYNETVMEKFELK